MFFPNSQEKFGADIEIVDAKEKVCFYSIHNSFFKILVIFSIKKTKEFVLMWLSFDLKLALHFIPHGMHAKRYCMDLFLRNRIGSASTSTLKFSNPESELDSRSVISSHVKI